MIEQGHNDTPAADQSRAGELDDDFVPADAQPLR